MWMIIIGLVVYACWITYKAKQLEDEKYEESEKGLLAEQKHLHLLAAVGELTEDQEHELLDEIYIKLEAIRKIKELKKGHR